MEKITGEDQVNYWNRPHFKLDWLHILLRSQSVLAFHRIKRLRLPIPPTLFKLTQTIRTYILN